MNRPDAALVLASSLTTCRPRSAAPNRCPTHRHRHGSLLRSHPPPLRTAMSSDHPEDPDGPPDRPDDHDGEGTQSARPGGTPAETRSRPEYYTDLRIAVSAEQTAVTQRTSAKEQAAAEQWQEKSAESRWIWQEYQRKWPPTDRTPADRPGDQTSSRGTRAESLDAAANARVESECDRIADRERDKISPALRATESQDPDRHLIGFEHRLKGRDRIKEKVTGHQGSWSFSRAGRFACTRCDPIHLSVPGSSLHSRRLVGYRPPERTRLRAAQAQEFLVR